MEMHFRPSGVQEYLGWRGSAVRQRYRSPAHLERFGPKRRARGSVRGPEQDYKAHWQSRAMAL